MYIIFNDKSSAAKCIGELSGGDFGPNVLKFITYICVLYNSLSIDVYDFYQGHRKIEIIWEEQEMRGELSYSLIRDKTTEKKEKENKDKNTE